MAHRTSAAASPGEGASTREPSERHQGRRQSSSQSTQGSATETAQAGGSNEAAQAPPQPGMVWVNLDSGVYHREGDRWYGKTKHGKYMSEADAEKAGYRASKTGPKQ